MEELIYQSLKAQVITNIAQTVGKRVLNQVHKLSFAESIFGKRNKIEKCSASSEKLFRLVI